MALGRPIQIRLNAEKQVLYEDAAEREGKPLGVYIRERLEVDDALREEIAALRNEVGGEVAALRRDIAGVQHRIEKQDANGEAEGEAAADTAVLIELLLLLRANTAPDKMSMIHAELHRLGLDVWAYNSGKH